MPNDIFHLHVPSRLDGRGLATLEAALLEAERGRPRVVVLEGDDGLFCQGMDLSVALGATARLHAAVYGFARCLQALSEAPRPTLAVVDGAALGGGLGLAAACDAVLATERSSFGLPELLFGLLPAMVLPVLLERVARQKLRRLAFAGSSVTAAEAQRLGLVDEVVATDKLPGATRRWVRALSRPDPSVVGAFKAHVSEVAHMNTRDALAHGASVTARRLELESVRAAVRQFVHAEDGHLPWLG